MKKLALGLGMTFALVESHLKVHDILTLCEPKSLLPVF